MRIGVNLLPLRPKVMGGAEIYVRDLVTEILATDEHDVLLVTGDVPAEAALPEGARCRQLQLRLASRARRLVPALAPVPLHVGQASSRGMLISRWPPSTASSKEISRLYRRSAPR